MLCSIISPSVLLFIFQIWRKSFNTVQPWLDTPNVSTTLSDGTKQSILADPKPIIQWRSIKFRSEIAMRHRRGEIDRGALHARMPGKYDAPAGGGWIEIPDQIRWYDATIVRTLSQRSCRRVARFCRSFWSAVARWLMLLVPDR